jgi:hypothetical protein
MNRLVIALAAATSLHTLCAVPASAQPADPNHEVGEPLWVAGLVTLGTTYLLTGATVTTLRMLASAREDRIWQGWVPLVGPLIMLGDRAGFDDTQVALTVLAAALQWLGAGALVVGAVLDAQPDPARPASGALRVRPRAGAEVVGVDLRLEF